MWPEIILDGFHNFPSGPYNGSYMRLLYFLFPKFLIGHLIFPCFEYSTEKVLEYTVYLDRDSILEPVLILQLRPQAHFDSVSSRQDADNQIRTRLVEIAAKCPLETMYGISALGRNISFYSLSKTKNGAPDIDPPTARYNTRGNDTAPETRWTLDVLEPAAETQIQKIVQNIEKGCAALTKKHVCIT